MNAAVSTSPVGNSSGGAVLNGWKEIALALGRSVRTVQRWEQTMRMPVRRVGIGPRAPVLAFKNELHLWLVKTPVEDRSQGVEETRARSKQRIIALVQSFFGAQTARQKGQRCSHCGSKMQYLDGEFWLFGTDNTWSIFVPFCPTCEPELCKLSPGTVH
jgi:hypothetical protein